MGKNRRLSPANTKQCRAPGTSDRTSGRVADTMTGGRGRGCRAEEKFSLLLSSAGKIDSSESCDGDAREQVEGRPPLSPSPSLFPSRFPSLSIPSPSSSLSRSLSCPHLPLSPSLPSSLPPLFFPSPSLFLSLSLSLLSLPPRLSFFPSIPLFPLPASTFFPQGMQASTLYIWFPFPFLFYFRVYFLSSLSSLPPFRCISFDFYVLFILICLLAEYCLWTGRFP